MNGQMEPQKLKLVQLKYALRQRGLSTKGRKPELIDRLTVADPTETWVTDAAKYEVPRNEGADQAGQEVYEEEEQEEMEACQENESSETSRIRHLEDELQRRERYWMEKEIDLLRCENELLRASPRQSTASTAAYAPINIRNIGELIGEYHGSSEDLQQWKQHITFLQTTYELDENAVKILIGSKLKGKALEWYRSRVEYLALNVEQIFLNVEQKMQQMFEHPIGRIERRKKFEAREW